MVNEHPERALALSYAPADRRNALSALLALDDRLGAILRATREPMVGQMRLTWWHQALCDLDVDPPPAEPVLAAVASRVLSHGVTGERLAGLVEGWEALLDVEPDDTDAVGRAVAARGSSLFSAAATVLGASDAPMPRAGEAWALADLALHSADHTAAKGARAAAGPLLDAALAGRWPRALRPLGALLLTARFDLAGKRAPGHPRRVGRLALHGLTGL